MNKNVIYYPQVEGITPTVVNTEKEPCDDAVSRQAVIQIFDRWLANVDYNYSEQNIMKCAISEIEDLPPVESKRQSGHWFIRETYPLECESWECSECQEIVFEKSDYCPNCGSRMEGDAE